MGWHLLPNLITGVRLLLVAPIVYAILASYPGTALLMFCVAGISDGLDGWLARRYQWQSRVGALLDPIADKTLMLGCMAALCIIGAIPLWLFIILLVRDLIIVCGAAAYQYLIGTLEAQPTLLGKFTTVLQIALVFIILLDLATELHLGILVPMAVIGVTLASFSSGMHYVAVWSARARDVYRQRDRDQQASAR